MAFWLCKQSPYLLEKHVEVFTSKVKHVCDLLWNTPVKKESGGRE